MPESQQSLPRTITIPEMQERSTANAFTNRDG